MKALVKLRWAVICLIHFSVQNGLTQGDVLLPLLNSFSLKDAIKKIYSFHHNIRDVKMLVNIVQTESHVNELTSFLIESSWSLL
jgi:hypothetical protein